MKRAPIAAVLALLLSAPLAQAQDVNAANMAAGLTMLQTEVANAFRQYKIDADPMTLTLAQLVEVVNVVNDADQMGGGNGKAAIEAAIARQ